MQRKEWGLDSGEQLEYDVARWLKGRDEVLDGETVAEYIRYQDENRGAYDGVYPRKSA